ARARGDRADAVEPQRDSSVRRRAEPQRVQEEAEPGPAFLGRDSEQAEDALLDLRAVDPDRAGAELPPVDDHVVGPRPHAAGVALETFEVLVAGGREGVVHRKPGPRFLVESE